MRLAFEEGGDGAISLLVAKGANIRFLADLAKERASKISQWMHYYFEKCDSDEEAVRDRRTLNHIVRYL